MIWIRLRFSSGLYLFTMINASHALSLQILQESFLVDIRIAGHYYSDEAIRAKHCFPASYESTEMFWLINRNGAYGARCGLLQVIKEIILALIKRRYVKNGTRRPMDKYNCQINLCGISKYS